MSSLLNLDVIEMFKNPFKPLNVTQRTVYGNSRQYSNSFTAGHETSVNMLPLQHKTLHCSCNFLTNQKFFSKFAHYPISSFRLARKDVCVQPARLLLNTRLSGRLGGSHQFTPPYFTWLPILDAHFGVGSEKLWEADRRRRKFTSTAYEKKYS